MKKILVIEDEPTIRDIIAEVLEAVDYQVLHADNGASGLQLAWQSQPDLILCDIMLPGLDGYEVLSSLRQNLDTAAIPIVFISARADRRDVRRGMMLGADDYLTKPFGCDELLSTVAVRLERQSTLVQAHTVQSNRETEEHRARVARLELALHRSEFLLHYQPQICLKTGQIIGAEALVRWQTPEKEMISPGQFIPLAESTGLILPLGDWVLRTVCTQIKTWQERGLSPPRIGVNLSSLQFNQEDLTYRIGYLLERTDICPDLLGIELTESLLIQNIDRTITRLGQLRSIGIQVAIDDFGTGFASLGYLQHFPFDVLKIDQCFVRDIDQNPKNAAIAIALIQMAHGLDLKVIAEGVETVSERNFLIQQGCDYMQGYQFSPPIPAAQFEKLLMATLFPPAIHREVIG